MKKKKNNIIPANYMDTATQSEKKKRKERKETDRERRKGKWGE